MFEHKLFEICTCEGEVIGSQDELFLRISHEFVCSRMYRTQRSTDPRRASGVEKSISCSSWIKRRSAVFLGPKKKTLFLSFDILEYGPHRKWFSSKGQLVCLYPRLEIENKYASFAITEAGQKSN
jgi:hypothetical protein